MCVSRSFRKYSDVRFCASLPPRHGSWRTEPSRADPPTSAPRFYVVDLHLKQWVDADGTVRTVLGNDKWSVKDLFRTRQFIPVDFEAWEDEE